jgi:hypothetical protein
MNKLSLIAATTIGILSIANARFLQTNPGEPGYDNKIVANAGSLPCGACILSNYTFCVYNRQENYVHTTVNQATADNSNYCCPSSGCVAQTGSATYNCSNSFNDRVYAKFICPFNTDVCGVLDGNFTLAKVGD